MQFVFEKREGSSHFIAFFSKTSRKCLTKRKVRPSHHLFHAWMQITVGFSSCESKKRENIYCHPTQKPLQIWEQLFSMLCVFF